MIKRILTGLTLLAAIATSASAQGEREISFYLGAQSAPHSGVSGNDPSAGGVGPFSFTAGWEGRSFEAPVQYGIRATWWQPSNLGFGVELNHTKVYADAATLAANPGFSRLELSDGLNIITANVLKRWPRDDWRFTPYAGFGLGVAVPHVDVQTGGSRTFGYELTGPAAMIVGGVSYRINDRWSVFGEYKGTYSSNKASLTGGGTLNSDIITNALNFGASLNF